ncbi:MAG: hypothetical protein H7230_02785 [Candidatus Parcubacteria bacterium]|nr:hypothetical protein [Candidatus Paceibacterota bacterium]
MDTDIKTQPSYQDRLRRHRIGNSNIVGLPPIPEPPLSKAFLTQIALNQTQLVYDSIEPKKIPTLISLVDDLIRQCKENAPAHDEFQKFQQLIRYPAQIVSDFEAYSSYLKPHIQLHLRTYIEETISSIRPNNNWDLTLFNQCLSKLSSSSLLEVLIKFYKRENDVKIGQTVLDSLKNRRSLDKLTKPFEFKKNPNAVNLAALQAFQGWLLKLD